MERIQVHHKKDTDTVFVSFYDGSISGTIEITPEQAEAIGQVGKMAALHRATREDNRAVKD